MRIISGVAKGRKLKQLKGDAIRPTTDRVKETIFNILSTDVVDVAVLDVFAGSGNLGLEALSRGALSTHFVETSYKSINIIKENMDLTGLRGEIIKRNAIEFIKRCSVSYGIIFADPPYNKGFIHKILEAIHVNPFILNNEGILILEHSPMEPILLESSIFKILREKSFGETLVTFITKIYHEE